MVDMRFPRVITVGRIGALVAKRNKVGGQVMAVKKTVKKFSTLANDALSISFRVRQRASANRDDASKGNDDKGANGNGNNGHGGNGNHGNGNAKQRKNLFHVRHGVAFPGRHQFSFSRFHSAHMIQHFLIFRTTGCIFLDAFRLRQGNWEVAGQGPPVFQVLPCVLGIVESQELAGQLELFAWISKQTCRANSDPLENMVSEPHVFIICATSAEFLFSP
jgi:hypothetical protein